MTIELVSMNLHPMQGFSFLFTLFLSFYPLVFMYLKSTYLLHQSKCLVSLLIENDQN